MSAPAPPRPAPAWYVPAFDGLRGLLCVIVMAGHAGFPPNVLWLALPVFFVMSGYFITRILLARPAAGRAAGAWLFARDRALRLLPLYLAFVAVLTIVGLVLDRPASIRGDLVYLWTVSYDVRLVTQGWDADLYSHVWSVAVEVQLYALFAVTAILLPRRAYRTFLVALVVGGPLIRLVAGMALVHGAGLEFNWMIEVMQGLPFAYVDAFAIGGLLAHPELYRRVPDVRTLALGLLALIAVISTIQVVVAAATGAPFPLWRAWDLGFPIDHGWLWGYSLLGLIAVVLIVTVDRDAGPLPRLFRHPVLMWLGERSYSIYLLHVPVFVVGHKLLGSSLAAQVTVFVVCGALTVAASAVTYRWIELPFLRRKRRPTLVSS